MISSSFVYGLRTEATRLSDHKFKSNSSRFHETPRGLNFELKIVDFLLANILDGVWWQWIEGDRGIQFWDFRGLASVENNIAGGVATDEVTPTRHEQDCGPAVGMQGHDLARQDAGLDEANSIVFEKQRVVVGRGDQGVERVRPGPRLVGGVFGFRAHR